MQESANRLRKKIKSYGYPVLSEDDLTRYRCSDIVIQKVMMFDLQKRSGLFTGRYGSLLDFTNRGSYSKQDQTGRKAKK